eukprot:gnl/TRDRNA2_/TRDRNA2_163103_c0_seq2.p1 gnl/TRDRNA2_/TRDRNA2_163103_c0~~gnl/TRDRNA2_/TRDRNA2_163103_c0_seq2.p1  ORF type:complete len:296 (-),score=107.03 gnl/TRDRNA2_/TRDRNA2_163103_c0_seq2:41-928(-)
MSIMFAFRVCIAVLALSPQGAFARPMVRQEKPKALTPEKSEEMPKPHKSLVREAAKPEDKDSDKPEAIEPIEEPKKKHKSMVREAPMPKTETGADEEQPAKKHKKMVREAEEPDPQPEKHKPSETEAAMQQAEEDFKKEFPVETSAREKELASEIAELDSKISAAKEKQEKTERKYQAAIAAQHAEEFNQVMNGELEGPNIAPAVQQEETAPDEPVPVKDDSLAADVPQKAGSSFSHLGITAAHTPLKLQKEQKVTVARDAASAEASDPFFHGQHRVQSQQDADGHVSVTIGTGF